MSIQIIEDIFNAENEFFDELEKELVKDINQKERPRKKLIKEMRKIDTQRNEALKRRNQRRREYYQRQNSKTNS